MSLQRPPFWLYAVAAAFLGFAATVVVAHIERPEDLGIQFDPGAASARIMRIVTPDGPADRAGLRPGDTIVAWDGVPIANRTDFLAQRAFWTTGTHRLLVDRGGHRFELSVALSRAGLPYWRGLLAAQRVFDQLHWILALTLAVWIAFRRPRDPHSLAGALFLAEFGLFFLLDDVVGMFGILRSLPWPVSAFLLLPLSTTLIGIPVLATFFAVYPTRIFRSRRVWFVIWIPVGIALPWFTYVHYRAFYSPEYFTSLANLRWAQWTWVYSAVTCITVLVLRFRRSTTVQERRRVRVLVLGPLIALSAVLAWSLTATLPPLQAFWTSSAGVALRNSSILVPVSFAYAIARHELFGIRVVVRQGLRYAAARGLLLALVPVSVLTLVFDLLAHGDRPLFDILSERGFAYGGIAFAAMVAHWRQREWLHWLDRRFFREQYDTQVLLLEIAGRVHQAPRFFDAAAEAVTRIAQALHPEFVAVLVRQGGSTSFDPLCCIPEKRLTARLPADAKFIGLVRLLNRPVPVTLTPGGWLDRQLPPDEADFLRTAGIDQIIPVTTGPMRTEALLTMGPKKSEEPYTRDDQTLLHAIASAVSLHLDREGSAGTEPGFHECATCGRCFDATVSACPQHGNSLRVVPLPRRFARYELQRRVGSGGMGSVYEAFDPVLKRAVALKLIREDQLGGPAVMARFEREARALAAFSHPNIVTIHDFGIVSGRAFLVMELLQGITLRSALRVGPLSPERVIRIVRDLCSALSAAHERNLIHRDLKPENIILLAAAENETAKVLDFGIVGRMRADDETETVGHTMPGAVVGTPRYMSPEQLRGGSPEPQWDLWALGVITYEMVTGRFPLATGEASLAPALSHWQGFFERTLSARREERPQGAEEFLRLLRATLTREVGRQSV